MKVSLSIGKMSAYIYPVVGETLEGKPIIQYTPDDMRVVWDSGDHGFLVTLMDYVDAVKWLESNGWGSDGRMFEECSGWVYRNYNG